MPASGKHIGTGYKARFFPQEPNTGEGSTKYHLGFKDPCTKTAMGIPI